MDRQDAKPRRPSLLAGAEPSPANAPRAASPRGRILADVAPATGTDPAAGSGARRLAGPLLALAVLAALGGWWLLSAGTVTTAPASPSDTPMAAVAPEPTSMAAATIIDDAGPDAGSALATRSGTGDGGAIVPAVAQTAASASPFDALAAAPAEAPVGPVSVDNPFATIAPAPAAVARAPMRARARQPAGADDADLLSILLGNIHGADAGGQSGLDALLAGIQAEPVGSSSAPQRNGRPLRVRSEQIQSNLRECPPANTPEGLACRQEICAVYAGRDPACPAG